MPNRHVLLIVFILPVFSFSQSEDYRNDANTLLNKAFAFYKNDKDSLSFYLDKVNQLALQHSDIEMLCDSYNVESWNASYFGELDLMNTNINKLDSLVKVFQNEFNQSPNYNYYYCQINYTKGQYYNELKVYEKSKSFFDKIILKCENLPKEEISEDLMILFLESNIYIALMLTDEHKFSLAEDYLKKNIRLINNRKVFEPELKNTQIHLANIYKQNKEYEKSNRIILKCLPFYRAQNNSNRMITSYKRIIENHIDLKQLDSAAFYLQSLKDWLPEDHQLLHLYYSSNLSILEQKKDYKNALLASKKRLNILKKKWGRKHIEVAEAYQKIGEINSKLNQPDNALVYFNKALDQFSNDSSISSINLSAKFKILNSRSQLLNKEKKYIYSLKSADEAISCLDLLKPTFTTKKDKFFLIENAFSLFENGIEAAYQLYQNTKEGIYIDKAMFYSEKSKSTLLLESLLSAQAASYAKIPKDLIEREKHLKVKITYLENEINKNVKIDLQDELFNTKKEYLNLVKDLELNYKKYFDLKYNAQVLSLSNLQKWLAHDTALVSYFYGDNAIYIITITKTTKNIDKVIIDEKLEDLLTDSYSMLNNPKSDLNILKSKTNQIYKKLVENSIVITSKEKLIIIADGLLSYLPFSSFSISSNNYLVEKQSISYANSATLLFQLESNQNTNNDVLAFAPSFNYSSSLLSLPNNVSEVNKVLNHFTGQSYINENATLQNFNKNNSDFGIIHLATHAIIEDENPEYSYLAFSEYPQSNNLLYINDLYNLDLNANMVTLSACESGIGSLKRGEGMLSLARGFYFSGTASIASTLWKVDDTSSSYLMNEFYQNLAKGNTKDMALRNAKLNFIKSNKDNRLSHPYYWSCFIISGDTTALTTNYNWFYLSIAIFILTIILLVIIKKKRTFKLF